MDNEKKTAKFRPSKNRIVRLTIPIATFSNLLHELIQLASHKLTVFGTITTNVGLHKTISNGK